MTCVVWSMEWCGVVCGVVRCGLWSGAVWSVEWCGVVCGVVRCGLWSGAVWSVEWCGVVCGVRRNLVPDIVIKVMCDRLP